MTASFSPASPADSSADGPSSTVRLLVTLFLLWHLFAVGLAWLTVPRTVTPGMTSALLTAIKVRTPLVVPYLQALWLDVAYDFRYTNALPQDIGCLLQADVGSGDQSSRRVIPDPSWPERKRQQYQRLSNEIAGDAARGDEGDEPVGRLLLMIGGEVLRDSDATKVEFNSRRPREDRLEALAARPPADRDVANETDYETVYRAAVTRGKDGQLSLIKLDAAARSAPVTAPSGTPAGGAKPAPQ